MTDLLLAWFWQGVAIAIVATIVVRLIPQSVAAYRHAIWWLALVSVVSLLVPGVVNGGRASVAPALVAASATPVLMIAPPPAWVLSLTFCVWVATATFGLLRVALSLSALRGVVYRSQPFDPERETRLAAWSVLRKAGRRPRLLVSPEIAGACAIGIGRPTVVVSGHLVHTLDDAALEAIVLHEHAHLERYDDWTRALEQVLVACTSLHPAVWWISRQLGIEREMACDQRVVQRTGMPVLYARWLTLAAGVAARSRGTVPIAAPGSSTTRSLLRARVERLLAYGTPRLAIARGGAAAAVVTIVASVSAVSQCSALVAFAGGPAEVLRATTVWAGSMAMSAARAGLIDARDTSTVTALRGTSVSGQQVARPRSDEAAVPADIDVTVVDTVPPAGAVSRVAQGESPLLEVRRLPSTHVPDPLPVPQPVAADRPFMARVIQAGTATAEAGVVTGKSVSRASVSVGRWFRNARVAVAGTF